MSDRYDDYERSSQGRRWEGRENREGQNRGNFGREEQDYRNQGRGNWDRDREQYGSGEWDRNRDWERHREPSYGQGGRESYYGRESNYGSGYGSGRESNFGGRESNYGGRESSYGGREANYGNREPGYDTSYGGQRGAGERDPDRRGGDWQRTRWDFNRDRGGDGPFGAGSAGFGTGYRSGEAGGSRSASSYSGIGGYTGYGSYGSESYYGGAGSRSQQGRFSGRGPKGYQRGDDRIREDVCEHLTHHPEVDASEIEVKVNNGEVTLTGTIDDRQGKRMAEEIAENVSGVKDVHNQVRVREREFANAGSSGSSSGSMSTSSGGSSTGSTSTGSTTGGSTTGSTQKR